MFRGVLLARRGGRPHVGAMMTRYEGRSRAKPMRRLSGEWVGFVDCGRDEEVELTGATVTFGGETVTMDVQIHRGMDEHGNGTLRICVAAPPAKLRAAVATTINGEPWTAGPIVVDDGSRVEFDPGMFMVTGGRLDVTGEVELTIAGKVSGLLPSPKEQP